MALNLPINAPPALVMAALSTPSGLAAWWVQTCAFHRGVYYFAFANGEKGQAKALEISRLHFALELLQAPAPWRGVRLRFGKDTVLKPLPARAPEVAPRATEIA